VPRYCVPTYHFRRARENETPERQRGERTESGTGDGDTLKEGYFGVAPASIRVRRRREEGGLAGVAQGSWLRGERTLGDLGFKSFQTH